MSYKLLSLEKVPCSTKHSELLSRCNNYKKESEKKETTERCQTRETFEMTLSKIHKAVES